MSPNGFDVTLDQSFDWPDASDVVSSLVFAHVCERERKRRERGGGKKRDYNTDVRLL